MPTIKLELKATGWPNLEIIEEVLDEDPIKTYERRCQEWEALTGKAVGKSTGSKKKAADSAADVPPAEADPVPSKKKSARKHAAQMNTTALQLARKAIILIQNFSKLREYELVEQLGFAKEMGSMSVSELQQVVNTLRDTVSQWAQNHEEAKVFLEITEIIETSNELHVLESRKDEFKGWKVLSAHTHLFQEAKRLYEEKKALLRADELISEEIQVSEKTEMAKAV